MAVVVIAVRGYDAPLPRRPPVEDPKSPCVGSGFLHQRRSRPRRIEKACGRPGLPEPLAVSGGANIWERRVNCEMLAYVR